MTPSTTHCGDPNCKPCALANPDIDRAHIRTFPGGAQRNAAEGKGRFDLIPAYALKALAKRFEEGAKIHGADNWRKGLPKWSMLDSALRHLNEYKRGDESEDHLAAAAWNVFVAIETRDNPELSSKPPVEIARCSVCGARHEACGDTCPRCGSSRPYVNSN